MVKKIILVLSVLVAAVWVLFIAAGVLLSVMERTESKEDVQIFTETAPIYNHFPQLPETSEIQWCSRTSNGIGLTTVQIYFFAFYDHDISDELQEMKIENQSEEIELHFVPDGIAQGEKWRPVENAGAVFQTGIKDTEKMGTSVYINEAGTILYIEAIGD